MMFKTIRIITILTLLPILGFAQTTKVLFIGNSYTGVNNLPQLTFEVAISTGDTLIIDSHTPGGQRLMDHAVSAQANAKIASNNWDYVVLQAQSQEPSWPIQQVQTEVFAPAKKLCDTIRANNSCTRPVFYMTWGRENGDASNCANWPPVCTYTGMDSLLNERYQTMGADNDAYVSPVGAVWHYIRDTYPQIDLYAADGSHPSVMGTYVAACTFYTVFLQKDPTFITYEPAIDPLFAENIRKSVKEIVYDSLLNWNIGKFKPVADFSFIKSNSQFTITCTNSSTYATDYLWNFGDGVTSSLENPVHTYTTMGVFPLVLESFSCGDTATKLDTVVFVMGVNELLSSKSKVYPNPSTGWVNIETPSTISITKVLVLNAQGKLVLNSSTTTGVDLRSLPNGVYWIKIQTKSSGFIVLPILNVK